MLGFLLILCMINLCTFAAFGFDKRQASAKNRRISERTLLFMALFGGWIGAKAGQHYFRHKTTKQPFKNWLNAIPYVYAALGGLVIVGVSKNLL